MRRVLTSGAVVAATAMPPLLPSSAALAHDRGGDEPSGDGTPRKGLQIIDITDPTTASERDAKMLGTWFILVVAPVLAAARRWRRRLS